MVLTARWKDNLHELPRSTGCTSAALNMIKLYCLIQKKPVFFKLIWNESPIQAFNPPKCFAGFLNHHKFRTNQKDLVIIRPFGSPRSLDWHLWRPWRPRVAKKTMDVYDVFPFHQYKRFEKREANWSPPKRDIRHWRRGRNFFEPWCFASGFSGAWSHCNKDNCSPGPNTGAVKSKKMRSLYISLSPWRVFRSLFSYIAHFK